MSVFFAIIGGLLSRSSSRFEVPSWALRFERSESFRRFKFDVPLDVRGTFFAYLVSRYYVAANCSCTHALSSSVGLLMVKQMFLALIFTYILGVDFK